MYNKYVLLFKHSETAQTHYKQKLRIKEQLEGILRLKKKEISKKAEFLERFKSEIRNKHNPKYLKVPNDLIKELQSAIVPKFLFINNLLF